MSYFFKLIASLVVSALIVSSACGKELKKLEVKTLFHDNKNVIGQPITYPSGSPLIISELITFPAGQETNWHTHDAPIYGYILEGELTVDYGEKGRHIYKKGDVLIEAIHWSHKGKNTGKGPARILVVYMGSDQAPEMTPLMQQKNAH